MNERQVKSRFGKKHLVSIMKNLSKPVEGLEYFEKVSGLSHEEIADCIVCGQKINQTHKTRVSGYLTERVIDNYPIVISVNGECKTYGTVSLYSEKDTVAPNTLKQAEGKLEDPYVVDILIMRALCQAGYFKRIL